MAIEIQIRRDTAANWTSVNSTLAQGELGLETDTNFLKIGNGTTVWTLLPYFGSNSNPFDQDLNTTDAVVFTGLTNNSIVYPLSDGTAGQSIVTDGSGNLSFSSNGDFLPLSGGTMTGNIVFDGTSGQYIGKGSFDTSRAGNYGISLVCSIGYEFNWQAGWLTTTEQNSVTPRPLYLDSLAGTTLRSWDSSKSTGTEVTHLGITFPDATTQITAPSISMTVPTSVLSVSGSPVSTTGTLDLTLALQNANTVFSGPATGSAATPTFRSLVATDIPALSYLSSSGGTISGTLVVTGSVSCTELFGADIDGGSF
jgi:hypothetical protein